MSYQVLARKWRPQTFSELVGQQHVVDAITNALDNDKLHHAYLFTGTRGVGKTTIARIFSKSLNCEQGQSANPCGKCDTCLDISDGRYVDLLEIDAASRTKVEDTRELLDNVQYRPTRGKYKVYLIDEVHMLSKHSFNALLKTLEEPPEHVKFLLATTDPQKLPVTVLSRCLQFSLRALTKEQIQAHLQHILEQEQVAFEIPALTQLAKAAQGSIRDSLSLTDQAIAQGNNQVSLAVVANMLGLLNKNQIIKLLKLICERDKAGALEQLDEIISQSPDYFQILSQLLALLHQVALTQVVPEICKLEGDSAKGIYTLAKSVSAEHIQVLYQIGVNGKRDLPHAPDARSGLQMTVLRMLAFSPVQKIDLDVDALIAQDSNLPAFESLPTPTASSKNQIEQTGTQAPKNYNDVELHKTETNEKTNQGSSNTSQNDVLVARDVTSNEHSLNKAKQDNPTPIEESVASPEPPLMAEPPPMMEQPPLPDEEPPMLDDMFSADFAEPEYHEYSSSENAQPSTQAKTTATSETPSDSAHSEVSNSSIEQTLALLKVQKELANFTTEKQEEAAAKKPVSETQVAEAAGPTHAYSLGHEFTSSASNLTAYLDEQTKLTHSSQIDDYSAFIDSTPAQGIVRQLLIHANCESLNNPLKLTLSEECRHICEDDTVARLSRMLSEYFSEKVSVEISFANTKNTPFEIQSRIKDMRLDYAKSLVSTDTSIQELIKVFDASIVEDSIQAR